MAEWMNRSREGSGSTRLFAALMIFVVCLAVGLRRVSTGSVAERMVTDRQDIRAVVAKGVTDPSLASMNVMERELFVALAFVHRRVAAGWTGSWGWAIVLLTVAMNSLLLPLRIASMRSGLKMQRLQPEIAAVKARYVGVSLTDPRQSEMAAEMAKLQKDNAVNMLGGCLPLLIQMPLLFAFFGMLRKAVALRGADWLWLHDLSSADPHHILPVLMCIAQLIVQVYTPSPGSNLRQQKIAACLMTFVFGYVSWHYASGVALYALTGSLVSIATQAVMNRSGLGREMNA